MSIKIRDIVKLDVLQLEDWIFAHPYKSEGLDRLYKVVRKHVKHTLHEATDKPLEVVLIDYSENGLAEIISKEMLEEYEEKIQVIERLRKQLIIDLCPVNDEIGSTLNLKLDLQLEGVKIPTSFITYVGQTTAV